MGQTTNMAELTIRCAEPEDAFSIADLLGELGYPSTPEFVKEKIHAIAESESDTLLVAETKGLIIGTAHLHIALMLHEKGKLARIMALVVTNKHQGRGVGKKLIAFTESMAQNEGCSKMEVTSAMHREPARRFYEGLSYVEQRRRFVKPLPD